MPNEDLSNHVPWLESKRRSRARRAEARKARSRDRRRRTGALVAAATLTFAAGGALAQSSGTGSSAVRSAGSTVAALQTALGITADGVYGPNTRRAVRNYQRNQGLAVDGIAGPVTLSHLGLAGSAARARHAARLGRWQRHRAERHAGQDRPVRVLRQPDRGLRVRPVPREVPVLARDLARVRRHRRPRRRPRGRAGPHRRRAATRPGAPSPGRSAAGSGSAGWRAAECRRRWLGKAVGRVPGAARGRLPSPPLPSRS